jgi:multiple sugar transport system permease protein
MSQLSASPSLSGGARTQSRSIARTIRKHYVPYLLVAPMAIAVTLVIVAPIVRNLWISFFDWYLARPGSHPFLGLENYRNLFADSVFRKSAEVTVIYIVVTVALRYVLGLGIALLLDVPFRGRGLARSIVIIPWTVPVVVACLVWIQMFDYQYGIINYWLMSLNLVQEPVKWLASTRLALPSAMVVNIWKGTPWAAIMLLAGLQSIPVTLYEVAKIDGADRWRQFWYVTLPMLKPVSLAVFLLLVIWTIQDFAIVYVLNKGGPANATEVLTIYIYHKAFEGMRMGVAAAGGVVLLIFSMLFTVLYLKIMGDEENLY